MHLDPIMPLLTGVALVILLVGIASRRLQQPHVVGYLIVGMLLGPHGFQVLTDEATLTHLGAIGVVLLLFFVGMEVSPQRLVANWKVSVIGTLLQILISTGCIYLLGAWLAWPLSRSILLGFVVSLSSTAVVLKLLQEWHELDTDAGQDVLGILLVQDLALVPMLIVLGFLGGSPPSPLTLGLQALGVLLIAGLLYGIMRQDRITLPGRRLLAGDPEMQLFGGLAICFGLALLTGLLGLSTALGAFVAGMVVAAARETHSVHRSLEPFRVVFVALFFVSIGMLIDLRFLFQHWFQVVLLVGAVLLTNTFINAAILRLLGETWRHSLYAGGLLAQIGEFSFVLAAVGKQGGIITDFAYQATLAVIALTLLLSPLWILVIQRLLRLRDPTPTGSQPDPD